MIRTLTAFYLHAESRLDAKRLPVIGYGLADAFRDFCRETFDIDAPLDYPPLKLVTVHSGAELAKALFTSDGPRGVLTDLGRTCCAFLIDDTLLDERVEGQVLRAWLRTFFPTIPKIVLTRPGHPDVTLPARRWVKKDAFVFEHPAKYHERLVHLFKSFWLPRFSDALRQYVKVKAGTNWHTPGHNGGRAFSNSPFLRGFHEAFGETIFRTDLSVSVESLGDLSSPEGRTPLSEAQRLTSEIFGTAQSRYITNGTSTSNKAMLMTLLRPGETVLIDRNCHKSVHHAVVTSGAVPRYLPARWNAALGVWGPVAPDDIRRALAAETSAATRPRLLILTTCTYEGVLYPVWEIARACERAGVLFYADEAWAAYLNFHPYYTFGRGRGEAERYNAVSETGGAHFAVQSTHKTLAAFSQASMIHVSMRFKRLLEEDASPAFRWLRRRFALHGHGSYEKFSHDLHEFLRYWHSTSPHYPFLAALDVAGVQMRLEGMKLIDERLRWAAAFRKRVAEACGRPENECFAGLDEIAGRGVDWRAAGYMKDPLKIVLMLRSVRACATFRKALLKAHIQWEKSSATTVLFLVTAGTVEEHFEYLFRVCREFRSLIGAPVRRTASGRDAASVIEAVSGQAVALPHDAALCDGELVTLEESEGRIASQFLVPYPPGVPVFIPGLKITRAMIRLVRDVIAQEGVDAVHGLFCRGGHAPYFVEVLDRAEEARVRRL